MKDELTSKLAGIFSDHDQKQNTIATAASAKKSAEDDFLQQFLREREGVVKPALQEIGEKLVASGHDFRIEVGEESINPRGPSHDAYIEIKMRPKGGLSRSGVGWIWNNEVPSFRFSANKMAKSVTLYSSTGNVSGPAGSQELGKLDRDYVQSRVIDWVANVLK